MTKHDEIEQLKERLFQNEQLLLESRAGLAMAVVEHFGAEIEYAKKLVLKFPPELALYKTI